MGLRIRGLKLEVFTNDDKEHSGYLEFDTHKLNVIRAENSMGKSTCVQSIIYALGLESMLIKKHEVPLPPAMKSKINVMLDGKEVEMNVKSSAVYLEIENDKGDVVTIKRNVKSKKDIMLIEVYEGKLLTEKQKLKSEPLELYARLAGSAKNVRGLYYWLKSFIGWELPEVGNTKGGLSELYIESVIPLFIIEQKSGWSQIQANTPHFGIRDVKRRAVEFVLSLDAYKNYIKFHKLSRELETYENRWKDEFIDLKSHSRILRGEIVGLSKSIPESWGGEIQPNIVFYDEESRYGLNDYIEVVENKLKIANSKYELNVENLSSELKIELAGCEEKVYSLESLVREHEGKINELNSIILENKDRIDDYKAELNYFKDIGKLQRLGGSSTYKIDQSKCPTCTQDVNGLILRSDKDSLYMSLDENKDFLSSEVKTLEIINLNTKKKISALIKDLGVIIDDLNDTREKARSIKDTLLESGKSPSKATFQEILRYEELVKELLRLKKDFSICLGVLESTFEKYVELKKKVIDSNELLSRDDKKKFRSLNTSITRQLAIYGFNSFDLRDLKISEESYHPTLKDIDWYFDVSASDNVRGLWAYTLGLHEVINLYELKNKFGLVLFDEPKQHSAKGESFQAFLNECSSNTYGDVQKLIFTSEPEASLKEISNKDNVMYINYKSGDRIIS